MSWIETAALVAGLVGWSVSQAVEPVCPIVDKQALRAVDVFDGDPAELATLVPDVAKTRHGHWNLAYVYDAGRTVTIRCKYADRQTRDVQLAQRVSRCDYKIDARKTLGLQCR